MMMHPINVDNKSGKTLYVVYDILQAVTDLSIFKHVRQH